MKRIVLLFACLAMTAAAAAQTDILARENGVTMMRGQNQSELMFEMCGYKVVLGNRGLRDSPRIVPAQRSTSPVQWGLGFNRVEFGFSMLTGASYAGYDAPDHDFLEQRFGKSIHFGFRFLNFGVALDRRRSLYFRTGVHLMCDNYVFSRNITVERDGDRIVPVELDRDYKKSKLMTASLGIPVQLCYTTRYDLHMSVLAYGDVVINAHTKYKKPKTKSNFSGVDPWQLGVGATLSFRGIGLYAKYGLTPLFRNGTAPKAFPLTVGLYFGR